MIKINLNRLPEIDREADESYKQLRTNLMFCGDDIKSIMFTSTQPNEGKSEVSFFVACSLAESGKRVLLMDADIRKSAITWPERMCWTMLCARPISITFI